MEVRKGANACAYCLRIREEISSGPVALDGSSLLSSFSVPLAVTVNVISIFKKGEKYLASNYRPVSLTCICCKLLEHIVVSNMLKHLDQHKVLVDFKNYPLLPIVKESRDPIPDVSSDAVIV
jgi:hypothetical protein